jgi:hypothetical protein
MNLAGFNRARNKLNDLCEKIMADKRPAYTGGSEDVLANFKRVGERLGTSPMQPLLTYWLKHEDSITAILSKGVEDVEGIASRLADARNYIDLIYALHFESEFEEDQVLTGFYDPAPLVSAAIDELEWHDDTGAAGN